jgi:hypothetical protein
VITPIIMANGANSEAPRDETFASLQMTNNRSSTACKHKHKHDKQDTHETNTNTISSRILKQFTGTPCDVELVKMLSLSVTTCPLKIAESVQTEFAAGAHRLRDSF